jgi:cell division protein FtsI (penicillin-binding protein 3)
MSRPTTPARPFPATPARPIAARPTRPVRPAKPTTPGLSRAARQRAYAAAALMTLLFAGVSYHAYGLQVTDGAHYQMLADRQHVRSIEVAAPRGAILDLRGRPLAVTTEAESVFVNSHEVIDVTATSERLATALGIDQGELEARLGSGKRFAWVARRVTPAQAAAVRAAKLPGIGVTTEPRRSYPGGTSAGPVLGVADIDGKGVDGIELALDDALTGKRARFTAVRDAHGKVLLEDGLVDATPGATVTLTIDRTIQGIADAAIADAVIANKAKSGVAIVMEVGTGRVLAMASYPTFDPNAPTVAHTAARDRGVTDVYEIGSVMKPFTIATALENGVTRPDELWDVEGGSWQVGPKIIRDVDHDVQLTTSEIIKRSSNVGAAKIGLRLGAERLAAGLRAFGFGKKTGIELPGEQSGRVRDGKTWREIELATISFGYGVTVTPLQLAAGVAAIADGGMYSPPRVIERIVDGDGVVVRDHTDDKRRVISAKTAAEMLPILRSVFDKGKLSGTAGTLNVPGFACGGKTGTAHKYDPALKGYSPDRYVSSFAGIAPIDHPRIVVVAVVDDPSGGDHFGSKVAGPVFARVASESLRYLGVPGGSLLPPPAPGAPVPAAKAAPAHVDPAEPAPIDEVAPSGPDFRGLGVARAIDRARAAGVRIEIEGSGRVASQEEVVDAAVPTYHLVFSAGAPRASADGPDAP